MLLSPSPLLLRFVVIGQGIAGLLPIFASAVAGAAAAAHGQGCLGISRPCLLPVPFSFLLLGRIFLLLPFLPFLNHHVRVHPAALATVVLGERVVVMVGVCVLFVRKKWSKSSQGKAGRKRQGKEGGWPSAEKQEAKRLRTGAINTRRRTGWTIAQDVDEPFEDGGRHSVALGGVTRTMR